MSKFCNSFRVLVIFCHHPQKQYHKVPKVTGPEVKAKRFIYLAGFSNCNELKRAIPENIHTYIRCIPQVTLEFQWQGGFFELEFQRHGGYFLMEFQRGFQIWNFQRRKKGRVLPENGNFVDFSSAQIKHELMAAEARYKRQALIDQACPHIHVQKKSVKK